MKKYIIPPIIYFICFALTLSAVALSVVFIERVMRLHGFWLMGDIDAVLALFVWGGVLFTIGNNLMFRLEKLETPNLAMHLRQSALLYLIFAIFGISVFQIIYNFVTLENYGVGMGTGFYFISALVALTGIITNGIAVFLRRTKKHTTR